MGLNVGKLAFRFARSYPGGHLLERRKTRRFNAEWDITVKGIDSVGQSFDESSAVENLSSSGVFLFMTNPVSVGAKLDVWIRIPFKRENWMKYSAEVVRVEKRDPKLGVAMKFDTARPIFLVK